MASGFRTESDSLGKMKVPKAALYGPQTARALENFQVSARTAHPALIRAYLRLKAAAASANASCGVLPASSARLITRAVNEILGLPEANWPSLFPVDPYQAGAGTSQNMNMNEVVANWANRLSGKPVGSYSPIHPNDHVNRSQSTNDSFPTAMRLALLEASAPLERELELLSKSLAAKGRAWMKVPKSARTHLQDAVPMRLGQEFRAYSVTLAKCASWVREARGELRELGIGGSAAGTGLTVPKGYRARVVSELSRLTGEKLRSAEDLCEAMQSQASLVRYSSALRGMALELTRICNDLRLMASGPMTGLAELILPAVQPGSSIMPGKVNPSILEMTNQALFAVLGFDQTVAYCAQAGQLELNVMMPVMAHTLLDSSTIAVGALRALREKCVDGIEPNLPRLKKYFESTPQVATALSPRLGYDLTAALVKEALASGASVIELVRARGLIPEHELAKLLAIDALTGPA